MKIDLIEKVDKIDLQRRQDSRGRCLFKKIRGLAYTRAANEVVGRRDFEGGYSFIGVGIDGDGPVDGINNDKVMYNRKVTLRAEGDYQPLRRQIELYARLRDMRRAKE